MGSEEWTGIVELARRVKADHQTCGVVDSELVVRLTSAILLFQQRMVGNLLRTMRRP